MTERWRRPAPALLAVFAGLLAACGGPNIQACKDALTKEVSASWEIDRKLWNEDCEAGHPAANIRKAAEMGFWRRCQARNGAAVDSGVVQIDELRTLCLTPEGEHWLETKWRAKDAPPLPAAPAPAPAPAPEPAPSAPSPAPAAVAAVPVSSAPAAAQVAASTPPAAVPLKTPPWVQPHLGRPTIADLPALKAPFDSLARLIVKTADPEDAWTAVSALQRGKPFLVMDGARGDLYGLIIPISQLGWVVALAPGYVESPLVQGRLATNAQVLAKDFGRRGLGGKPIPLAAVNPFDAQRKELVSPPGEPRRYGYPDGSVRVEYTSGQLAAQLLHELQHVDRRLDEGGKDRFLDERDSQEMQCRLLFRFRQADPGVILDAATKSFLSRCQVKKAMLSEADFLQPYADLPAAKALARGQARETSTVDQRRGREAEAFHQAWRKRVAQEYVARFKKWVSDQQGEAALMTPGEAQRARAQVEQLQEAVREDPWALIPGLDWTKPFRPPPSAAGN